jgi:hypothetical protein
MEDINKLKIWECHNVITFVAIVDLEGFADDSGRVRCFSAFIAQFSNMIIVFSY